MNRLVRKFETTRTLVPKPEQTGSGSSIGVIAYGTSHWAMVETIHQLETEKDIRIDYLRLRAYPFTNEVHEFVKQHDRVYVVDQNRDGQMHQLLTLDLSNADAAKLRSVRHYNGLPVDARSITDDITRQEGR